MVSGGQNTEPMAPVCFTVPTATLSGTKIADDGNAGQLIMSGAKLYMYSGTAWERVTSA